MYRQPSHCSCSCPCLQVALELSSRRRAAAEQLRTSVDQCLADLAMGNSRFDVRLSWEVASGSSSYMNSVARVLEVIEEEAAGVGEAEGRCVAACVLLAPVDLSAAVQWPVTCCGCVSTPGLLHSRPDMPSMSSRMHEQHTHPSLCLHPAPARGATHHHIPARPAHTNTHHSHSHLCGSSFQPPTPPPLRFKVQSSGLDRVEFLLAAGPAEPLRPLAAVASGGESARIMLALKAAPATAALATLATDAPAAAGAAEEQQQESEAGGGQGSGALSGPPIMVLDELDSGIGSRLGQSVGTLLRRMCAPPAASNSQILCVTHLPQVSVVAGSPITISSCCGAPAAALQPHMPLSPAPDAARSTHAHLAE